MNYSQYFYAASRKLSGEVTVMLENDETPLIDIGNDIIDDEIDEAEVMVSFRKDMYDFFIQFRIFLAG